MKRVIILGSRGMLGHMVFRFLDRNGIKVTAFDERWTPENHHQLSKQLAVHKPDVCINAVGLRECKETNLEHLMWTNGSLPGLISKALPPTCTFIHASSDAVFSSSNQGCQWDAPQHPDTEYGRSKQLGELGLTRANDRIIRCSIIGPERTTQRSLLSWFLKQNQPVHGYTNQLWNGITTLEWAKLSLRIIQGEPVGKVRILQPGILPPVSKYSLLKLIGRIYGHPVEIRPMCSNTPIQRSLIPNIHGSPIAQQILGLVEF